MTGAPASVAFCAVLAQVSWDGVGERLIASALVALIAAGVTAGVTIYVLKHQLARLTMSVDNLTETVRGQEREMAEMEGRRRACQLDASRNYGTREELVGVVVETAANHRETISKIDSLGHSLRESVGKVHGRADNLQNRVATIEGRLDAGEIAA